MDTETPATTDVDVKLFRNPWPAMKVGLVAMGLAYAASAIFGDAWINATVILLLVGLAGAGVAIAIMPGSPAVLGSAGVVTLFAALVADKSQWDFSAPVLFTLLTVLAAVAAILMLLPQTARRVAVSLLILFHFGGIMTAVTAAPPQSWVAGQMWTYIYRPYLQFMYLNNAYHFYSPEPGPATLLWFRIEYESDADGTKYTRWVKIPNLDERGRALDPEPDGEERRIPKVEFTRRLSLCESASGPGGAPANFKMLAEKRIVHGNIANIPTLDKMPIELQYREPNMIGKIWLASYVRHVARTYKHGVKPEKPVLAIKVYRIVHQIIHPVEYADGRRLDDESLYFPYFQGEYDKEGNLKSRILRFNEQGTLFEEYRDPFLYWLIPIVPIIPPEQKQFSYDYKVKDYLKIHAGDTDEDSRP